MREVYGKSDRGDLKEALKGISNPDAFILISNGKQFEQHVKELAEALPDVPSIAGTGFFYGDSVKEGGVGVIALSAMNYASTMPVHDISL